MEFCKFALAISIAATGAIGPSAAAHHPVYRPVKPDARVVAVANSRLWTRAATRAPAAHPVAGSVVALSLGLRDSTGQPLPEDELAQRIRSGVGLDHVAAPFAASIVDSDGVVTAAADHAGLKPVYALQGDGWAAVSTSAIELARLGDTGFDERALGERRLVGHHLGASTAYRGVVKLAPGHLMRMVNGVVSTQPYGHACLLDAPPPADVPEAVERHAARLREVVNGFLDAHPDSVLELSGGLDSRMVLAAVPERRRAGLQAMTIRQPGLADADVAAALAERYGLRHRVVDVPSLDSLAPAEAYRFARAAAERTDGMGAPTALAAFDWVESHLEPRPRLGGHGGEIARGAYYMQRQHPHVEPAMVDRFARWWVTTNSAVADAALAPGFAAESRAETRDRLREIFAGYGTDWLAATDEFFVRERLHRWAGPTLGDASLSRIVANPLLDPEVLELVRSVPRAYRSSSRYAAQVLDHLDPELARMRLSSGLRPIALSRRFTLTRQLGENTAWAFAGKAAAKASRKLRGAGHPAVGAPAVASLVVAYWRDHPGVVEPAGTTGLIDQDWLAQLLDGRADADPPTVDFLLNLGVAVDAGVTTSSPIIAA